MKSEEIEQFLESMQVGKVYFRNLGSSQEGVKFERFRYSDYKFFIETGFYYFEYEDEQIIDSKMVSSEEIREHFAEINSYALKDWKNRRA